MYDDCFPLLPKPVAAEEVHQRLGHDWVCPWCESERVSFRETEYFAASDWIELPTRLSKPQWVCEGCAIEIYASCNTEDFENAMDHDRVIDIALDEGVEPAVFRRACIRHQVDLIDAQPGPEQRRLGPLRQRLDRLLSTID